MFRPTRAILWENVDTKKTFKADSHIACRAHAAPKLFPCHAVPLRVQNVPFTFDLHSAAVSDSHLPCSAHALLRPHRSSQGYGTRRPSRDGLWATGPRLAPSGYHAEFHERHDNVGAEQTRGMASVN
jgi:hypothetical protein